MLELQGVLQEGQRLYSKKKLQPRLYQGVDGIIPIVILRVIYWPEDRLSDRVGMNGLFLGWDIVWSAEEMDGRAQLFTIYNKEATVSYIQCFDETKQ